MSVTLRVCLLIASIITIIWIFRRIYKLRIKMEDAIFWIFFAIVLLLLGAFPAMAYFFSDLLGIMSPANLVFLAMIILLFEKVFTLSAIVSQLEEKITVLSAELALCRIEKEKKEDSDGNGEKEEKC